MLENYVVLDLEMTGLNPKTDKILEVGAVRIRGKEKEAVFSAMIRQKRELPERVTELTGITNEMAAAGKEEKEVMEQFIAFLGEDVLVGQNLIFDYSFLKQWAVNHNLSFEKEAVDTLKLARKFLPAEQKKDLESLCGYFHVEREHAHRALDDALETWQIFEKLKVAFEETEPSAFLPKPLQYKVKKQSPATLRQKRYLEQFAAYHGIELPQLPEDLTKSEASRLTDRLISKYGKMNSGE